MLTATPSTRICCSCSYWYGPRTASANGHVYAMENAEGLCQLHDRLNCLAVDCCEDWVQWGIPGIVPTKQTILNCWEFHGCGYEDGGSNATQDGICPAYPNHGRSCGYLPDTKCHGQKIGSLNFRGKSAKECARCEFFASGHHEKLIIDSTVSLKPAWQRLALFEEITANEETEAMREAIPEKF